MIVPTNIHCIDSESLSSVDFVDNAYLEHTAECKEKLKSTKYKLEMEHKGAPAGYVFFKVDSQNKPYHPLLNNDFSQKDGYTYLTNDQMIREFENKNLETSPLFGTVCSSATTGWMRFYARYQISEKNAKGPAQPFAIPMPIDNKSLFYDHVLALPCSCSDLSEWLNRPKTNGWPPENVIERIKRLPAHVVPTGVKGSENERLQWRVCFTLAEIELVKSFNNIQLLVYVLLQMLVKEILESEMEVTGEDEQVPSLSYFVKNVMFWFAEEKKSDEFTEQNFACVYMLAVRKLQKAISENNLPCYMIPSRNLSEEKLSQKERETILKPLTKLTKEGFDIVRSFPQIRAEVENDDESDLEEKASKRRTAEYLLLSTFTLPPAKLADTMEMFNSAKSPEACLNVYRNEVLPHLRQYDTFGYLEQFDQLSDEVLFETLMSIYNQS